MKNYELKRENAVCLFIDLQDSLLNACFNQEELHKNSLILAKAANILNLPSIASLQYPKGLGPMNEDVEKELKDLEIVEKLHFSCLKDQNFKNVLEKTARKQVILLGLESHICCLQTARDLIALGYDVFSLRDALGSRKIENHENALNLMAEMGCVVSNTESVLFDLMKKAGTPEFKLIQRLIK